MNLVLAESIRLFEQIFTLLVIANVILSYFLAPYHPLRVFIDRLVEPLLEPIRRIVPNIGMFDFSPLVLIILVQLISSILVSILLQLR